MPGIDLSTLNALELRRLLKVAHSRNDGPLADRLEWEIAARGTSLGGPALPFAQHADDDPGEPTFHMAPPDHREPFAPEPFVLEPTVREPPPARSGVMLVSLGVLAGCLLSGATFWAVQRMDMSPAAVKPPAPRAMAVRAPAPRPPPRRAPALVQPGADQVAAALAPGPFPARPEPVPEPEPVTAEPEPAAPAPEPAAPVVEAAAEPETAPVEVAKEEPAPKKPTATQTELAEKKALRDREAAAKKEAALEKAALEKKAALKKEAALKEAAARKQAALKKPTAKEVAAQAEKAERTSRTPPADVRLAKADKADPAARRPGERDPCTRSTPADRLICGDLSLRLADFEMKDAYARALNAHADPEILGAGQTAWRRTRDKISDPDRLARVYNQRIRELEAAAAAARKNRSPG